MEYLDNSNQKCNIFLKYGYVVIRKLICNSPNDVMSGNFDIEKFVKDEVFALEIYYISS